MIEEMITDNLENEFIFYFFSDRKYCKSEKINYFFINGINYESQRTSETII
tara:strand:+ start:1112 stop:1264 length:153 start_codon:yes stop_codon:yes gene_type:complete